MLYYTMKKTFAVDIFLEKVSYLIEAESYDEAMSEGKKRRLAELKAEVNDETVKLYGRARTPTTFDKESK